MQIIHDLGSTVSLKYTIMIFNNYGVWPWRPSYIAIVVLFVNNTIGIVQCTLVVKCCVHFARFMHDSICIEYYSN